MKPAFTMLVMVTLLAACAKEDTQARSHATDRYQKLDQPGPAAGRAEFVSPVQLLPDPTKYSGKRVVLAGIWSTGFEHSRLDLENAAQDFAIWVDADWAKIDGPAGDFSRRKDEAAIAKPRQKGHVSYRILAEGTFYYRKPDFENSPPGFGHMSGSPGYFLIDRLFQFEPADEEPTQPGQSTRGKVPGG